MAVVAAESEERLTRGDGDEVWAGGGARRAGVACDLALLARGHSASSREGGGGA